MTDFATIPGMIRGHAAAHPDAPALFAGDERLDFGGLDALMDRIAASLQRDGIGPGSSIAICASSSVAYAATFLGALRAGAAVAPLAPSSTPEQLADMVRDAGAALFFLDAGVAAAIAPVADRIGVRRIALDGSEGGEPFAAWLAPEGTMPSPVAIDPEQPFNIIYSSGTTGTPKGIVQSHGMRWRHVDRANALGYGPGSVRCCRRRSTRTRRSSASSPASRMAARSC